jgi:HD-like signal output (HDOD) protein
LQIAGLLHDIGMAFRMATEPEKAAEAIEYAQAHSINIGQAEDELKMATHRSLGVYIIRECWNLPKHIETLVYLHDVCDHTQREKRAGHKLPPAEHKALDIIALADRLAHRFEQRFPNYHLDCPVSHKTLESIGISKEDLVICLESTKKSLEEIGMMKAL